MKLEVELKSSKSIPARQRAMLNILFTASWVDCFQSRFLRPFGLTGPQYNILRILNGSSPKGLSVLDIKSRMIDRSSNVSRLVEKLRLQELVQRVPHSDDRRMVVVSISDKGRHTIEEIDKAGFSNPDLLPGSGLSEVELLELGHLLDRYRD